MKSTGGVCLDDGKYGQRTFRTQEIRKIRPSVGCGVTFFPLIVVWGYDLQQPGSDLGNAGPYQQQKICRRSRDVQIQQDIFVTSIIYSFAILLTFKRFISIPISLIVGFTSFISLIGVTNDAFYSAVETIFFITFPVFVGLLVLNGIQKKRRLKKNLNTNIHLYCFEFNRFLFIIFLGGFAEKND